mgnify:CR=1 FL=1
MSLFFSEFSLNHSRSRKTGDRRPKSGAIRAAWCSESSLNHFFHSSRLEIAVHCDRLLRTMKDSILALDMVSRSLQGDSHARIKCRQSIAFFQLAPAKRRTGRMTF